ncbi:MAG: glucans biosynthesis glucosyltransferase MdoH [Syntrophales bacterium]
MDQKITEITGRRVVFFSAVGMTSLFPALLLAVSLPESRFDCLSIFMLILYAILLIWISFYFWTATFGFLVRVSGRDRLAITKTDRETSHCPPVRTAIIMPIHNEFPDRVFAGLEAVSRSLVETGSYSQFDFFVLSDSTDPDIRAEEEFRTRVLRCKVPGKIQVFYRNRKNNTGRKVGNIRDFCARWGREYRYMIVLDADSIMSGETIVRMVRIMEHNPGVALLQAPPFLVNRKSLFARVQQFASRAYGPIVMAGLNFWQGGEGNYWGHNAVIRIEPYVKHCELPRLPGKEPFGGELWSHDFVEAALLRRAGWEVWLAYDLEGSYEEIPPTLISFAARERRWCQGNIQHTRLIGNQGFHPISRLHLLSGIMSYLSAPILFLFIVASGLDVYFYPWEEAVFGNRAVSSLHPVAFALLVQTVFMFVLPRIFSLVWLFRQPGLLKSFGGRVRACLSTVLETLLSITVSPILIMFKTRFVISTLLGHGISWTEQRRDDHRVGLREAFSVHAGQTALGLIAGIIPFFCAGAYFWWFAPALLWLVFSVPISVFLSRADAGEKALKLGLFLIPEETSPPRVLCLLSQRLRMEQEPLRFEPPTVEPAVFLPSEAFPGFFPHTRPNGNAGNLMDRL